MRSAASRASASWASSRAAATWPVRWRTNQYTAQPAPRMVTYARTITGSPLRYHPRAMVP